MKTKVILPVFSFSLLMLIVLASCQEEDDLAAQQALLSKALTEMQTAYDKAKFHNDSLIMYQHDALMMQDPLHFEAMVQHCDDMFHQEDSMFTYHYDMYQSLSSDGGHAGGMMGNRMMAGGMMVQMQMDCQSAMNSLRQQHEQHCLR